MAGPLRANTTSSIKPEVHNVSQRHPKRTEPHKIWSKLDVQFRIYARADRKARNHKDTQTCSSQYSLQQVCVDPRSSDHSTTLAAAAARSPAADINRQPVRSAGGSNRSIGAYLPPAPELQQTSCRRTGCRSTGRRTDGRPRPLHRRLPQLCGQRQ